MIILDYFFMLIPVSFQRLLEPSPSILSGAVVLGLGRRLQGVYSLDTRVLTKGPSTYPPTKTLTLPAVWLVMNVETRETVRKNYAESVYPLFFFLEQLKENMQNRILLWPNTRMALFLINRAEIRETVTDSPKWSGAESAFKVPTLSSSLDPLRRKIV